MKTAREIRTEIANSFDIPVEKVRCSRCARWAYNNGGVLTSVCSSQCRMRKLTAINFVGVLPLERGT